MKSVWGVWIVALAIAMQGCVSAGQYHDLEAKHGHLLDVKETWDSEQAELSRRVEDTRLAYQRMTVDQGTIKTQLDGIQQALRSSKSDLQMLANKVDGQGNLFKEQQHQFLVVTDHFSQVISQVATLAETNHMLANRVEQLTKVSKQTATKVADVTKKMASVGGKRPSHSADGIESDEAVVKEKPVVLPSPVADAMPASGKVLNPTGELSGSSSVSSLPVVPDPSFFPSTSSGSLEGLHPVPSPVSNESSPVVSSSVSSTSGPESGSSAAPVVKSGRWQQLKDMVGLGRSTASKGTSVGSKPVVSSVPSHTGEALAASPKMQSLSTISSTPGVPAPGAVIDAPQSVPGSSHP